MMIKFRKFPVKMRGKFFYVVGRVPINEKTMGLSNRAYVKIYTWWHKLVYDKELKIYEHDYYINEDMAKDFSDLVKEAANDYLETLSEKDKNINKYRKWRKILFDWDGDMND